MFLKLFTSLLSISACGPIGNGTVSNQCVSFTVGQGTGCSWMCNYCQNTLGTTNYYFTTPVCVYQPGGCVGSPLSGVQYTCCSN
jgi:hypothetical protein